MGTFIETLFGIISRLTIFTILMPYEQGVLIRLGAYKKTIGPGGLYWQWPVIDEVLDENVVPTNFITPTIRTIDKHGKVINFSICVEWSIKDIKSFLLEVEDAEDNLHSMVQSTVAESINNDRWSNLRKLEFKQQMEKDIRLEAIKSGINIVSVKFVQLLACRTLSIISDDAPPIIEED